MGLVEYSKEGSFLSPTKNIAVITLNREAALNSINPELLDELEQALVTAEHDSEIRAVIITAKGEKVFSAGADLKSAAEFSAEPENAEAFLRRGQEVFRKIENFPKPVIAAINGLAVGGGLELALACDLRIAADTAKVGAPEVGLGLIPAWGGTQRLPKLIGMSRAKELILTGTPITAKEAEKYGIINKVVPADELMSTALVLATQIAGNAPIALKYAKFAINQSFKLTIEEGNDLEARYAKELFGTKDLAEGIMATLQKRKPEFKGE